MSHTPGPWTLPKFGGWEKELEIPEPKIWVDYDDVDREEAEANARLIAAAPEMLFALKEACVSLGECSLALTLYEVIAKAEGR
jgi:hypothetical protein